MGKKYGHPLRSTWYAAIRRCHNPDDVQYKNYGARGIVVCDRWRESFEAFAADMGPRPDGLTLDRINNDGNYEPGNCRWADKTTQNSNTRNTLMATWDGKTQTMSQWARDLGISNGTLWNRLQRMPVAEAMTQSIDELSRVRKWALSEIDTVLEMHQNGTALRVIAEEVHASKECVKRLIWRLTPIPATPAQSATAMKFVCCKTCGYQHSDTVICKCGRLAAPPSPAAGEATKCPDCGDRRSCLMCRFTASDDEETVLGPCVDCECTTKTNDLCDCKCHQWEGDRVNSSSHTTSYAETCEREMEAMRGVIEAAREMVRPDNNQYGPGRFTIGTGPLVRALAALDVARSAKETK